MEFQRVVKTPTVHGIAVSALKAKRGFVWGLFCFFGRGGGVLLHNWNTKQKKLRNDLCLLMFFIFV